MTEEFLEDRWAYYAAREALHSDAAGAGGCLFELN